METDRGRTDTRQEHGSSRTGRQRAEQAPQGEAGSEATRARAHTRPHTQTLVRAQAHTNERLHAHTTRHKQVGKTRTSHTHTVTSMRTHAHAHWERGVPGAAAAGPVCGLHKVPGPSPLQQVLVTAVGGGREFPPGKQQQQIS